MSLEALKQSAMQTREVLSKLNTELGDRRDSLAPSVWNEALLLTLSNQTQILEGLVTLIGGKAEEPVLDMGRIIDEVEAEEREEIAKEELSEDVRVAKELDRSTSERAIKAFDKGTNNFDKGIKALNGWLAGSGGTPFQARPKTGFAYLKVAGLDPAALKQRELRLAQFMGYQRLLGRIVHAEIQGEVWLYVK